MTKERGHVITRFAPSPNGWLHAGHAYAALFAHAFARARGGEFLLRIEDIDTTRLREEYVEGILEDLKWLGISWPEPVRRQSRHAAEYCAALEKLRAMGVLYPCRCTRSRIRRALADKQEWPRDPDGAPLYPGICHERGGQEDDAARPCGDMGWKPGTEPLPPAWRLNMQKALRLAGGRITWREEGRGPAGESGIIEADPARWGDVILGRRDIGVSYHIAVVVDDALQGITHVVRGQDLFHATAVHRLLQELLGLPEPVYVHHRLITDETGRKLAKSEGDMSLRELRARGVSAEELRKELGF